MTRSGRRLRPSWVRWHDAHRAYQRCRAGCHDEVEHASIRSPSLPFHPIRQPGNGGGQRQSLRGVVEPHVTATAGSTHASLRRLTLRHHHRAMSTSWVALAVARWPPILVSSAMAAGSAGYGAGSNTELRWPHVTATAGSTRRQPPEADFGAPSSDDVDELGRSRGSQMTSHTRSIGHGRRERGGGRWEQHGAPLETFSRLVCQSEMELATVESAR